MSAAISFGLAIEDIEEMTPIMVARATKAMMERQQTVHSAAMAEVFGHRRGEAPRR